MRGRRRAVRGRRSLKTIEAANGKRKSLQRMRHGAAGAGDEGGAGSAESCRGCDANNEAARQRLPPAIPLLDCCNFGIAFLFHMQ